MTDRPLPAPTPLSAPFWAAASRGTLVVQRCQSCGHLQWTPQPRCDECFADTLEWTPTAGRGTVYSYSIVHRPPGPGFDAPYVVAIVGLEEGPRLLTTLVGIETGEVSIGMPVEVAFETIDGIALYPFKPAQNPST